MTFFGVSMLALGPILSQLGEGANALPATLSIGIFVGTVTFGPVADKYGYKGLVIVGAIITLFGILGLANVNSMSLLHLSMLLLGTGGGIINGTTNTMVSEIYDDKDRGGRLGILSAFYCIGALLWTLLNYFNNSSFALPLNCVSVVLVLFIAFLFGMSFPKTKQHDNKASTTKMLSLLKYPSLLLFSFILFFQSGFESIINNFTVKFLESSQGFAKNVATLSLTWFIVGMLAGRLFLSFLLKKINDRHAVYMYLSVALLGLALLYLANEIILIYIAALLIGLGAGATFPVIFSYIGSSFRELAGTAFSIAMLIALCGQFTFNKVTGVLFDRSLFDLFPILIFFAIMVIMMLLLFVRKFKN